MNPLAIDTLIQHITLILRFSDRNLKMTAKRAWCFAENCKAVWGKTLRSALTGELKVK